MPYIDILVYFHLSSSRDASRAHYCRISINSAVTRHRPSEIEEGGMPVRRSDPSAYKFGHKMMSMSDTNAYN